MRRKGYCGGGRTGYVDSFSIRVRIIYSGTNIRKLSGVFPGFHNFPSLICWSMAMQFYHRPMF